MTRLIIAGSNGHIGSFLYKRLKEEFDILSTSLSKSKFNKNFYRLDLTNVVDVERFAKDCKKSDILIFLVGLAHEKGEKDYDRFLKVNKSTLVNLLNGLDKEDRIPNKIIFASSISVYGEQFNKTKYYENHNCLPQSPYAKTKLEAENYLIKNYKEKSWILRFSSIYSTEFTRNIMRRITISGKFFQVGDGKKKLSLCHMENVYKVVIGIIFDKIPTGVYNVSDKKTYEYKDIIDWKKVEFPIIFPFFFLKALYFFGKLVNNNYLKENSIKLISDNIYPPDKINNYITLDKTLKDLSL